MKQKRAILALDMPPEFSIGRCDVCPFGELSYLWHKYECTLHLRENIPGGCTWVCPLVSEEDYTGKSGDK